MLPALATAIDRLAGDAPAIGASMIGTVKPYRAQKALARSSGREALFPPVIPAIYRGFSRVPRGPSPSIATARLTVIRIRCI
jgi:hypothetical protein